MMNNEFGWRAKIGLVLPSPNWVIETWFNRVAPEGVSFHASRVFINRIDTEKFLEVPEKSLRAIDELMSARVDAIAYCCAASTLVQGPEADQELIERFSAKAEVPVVTANSSLLAALGLISAKKLVIVHPFPKDFDQSISGYLTKAGYDILAVKGMGILNSNDLAKPSPEEIYQFAKDSWVLGADALAVTCNNFRVQAAIQALEDDFKKPVITSVQATLWNVLKTAGVNIPIKGYGRLLAGM